MAVYRGNPCSCDKPLNNSRFETFPWKLKRIELHQHTHKDGMMQMRQVDKIVIPAKSSVELKPGGYHVMLIGLAKKIKKDDLVELNLLFGDDSNLTIKVKVMSIMQRLEMQKDKPQTNTPAPTWK